MFLFNKTKSNLFYNQYKILRTLFYLVLRETGWDRVGVGAGAGSSQPTFSLKIDKLFTGLETITNMMTFISRGLSIKDVCIVGEGRVVKNGQRWTKSNTLSSKKNLTYLLKILDWSQTGNFTG